MRNIIDNAIKYSPQDSDIDLQARMANGFAVIEVCDRGRGLGGSAVQGLRVRFQQRQQCRRCRKDRGLG